MQVILDKGESDALLFVHHAMVWNIKETEPFQQMDINLLRQFKEKGISVYNLHTPLDSYGQYSTSVTLAKALEIEIEKPFAPYHGGLAGVFGNTGFNNLKELSEEFSRILGHRTSLYRYGSGIIRYNRVAVVAGGGNSIYVLAEIVDEGINTFLTGITVLNEYSRAAHEFASEKKINILGGTHYSTEKFACVAMCEYFKKLNLHCEFIEAKPVMEDL